MAFQKDVINSKSMQNTSCYLLPINQDHLGKWIVAVALKCLHVTMMEINILVQKDMLAALKHCNGQGNSQSGTSATGRQMCHTCGPTQHLKKHCPQNKDTAHIQKAMVPKIIWKTTLPKPNEAETQSGDRKLGIGVLSVVSGGFPIVLQNTRTKPSCILKTLHTVSYFLHKGTFNCNKQRHRNTL